MIRDGVALTVLVLIAVLVLVLVVVVVATGLEDDAATGDDGVDESVDTMSDDTGFEPADELTAGGVGVGAGAEADDVAATDAAPGSAEHPVPSRHAASATPASRLRTAAG